MSQFIVILFTLIKSARIEQQLNGFMYTIKGYHTTGSAIFFVHPVLRSHRSLPAKTIFSLTSYIVPVQYLVMLRKICSWNKQVCDRLLILLQCIPVVFPVTFGDERLRVQFWYAYTLRGTRCTHSISVSCTASKYSENIMSLATSIIVAV